MDKETYEEAVKRRLAEELPIQAERKRAYQHAFNQAPGAAVLADLEIFCRARLTCVAPGDRDRTCVLEGRREVFLRIQDYLQLSPEELTARLDPRPAQGATSHD